MKKGFTLIELLAVIVILAIIGVITVPIIENVIEESKKQLLEASIRGLIEATDYFAVYNDGVYEFIFDENNKGITLKGDSLDYNGSVDAEGKLVLDSDGNISLCLMNDDYYAYKNYNSGIVVGNRSEDTCSVEYDNLTNKYIAFLESEGSSSNVYSKDEEDNLIDNVNTNILNNTNEITNVKSSIETLQTNLSNYALKSELEITNTNLENISSIVSNNQSSINTNASNISSLQTTVNSLNNRDNLNAKLFRTGGNNNGYTGDVNNIKTPGMYNEVISASATNGPGYYAYLLVFNYAGGENVTQVAFVYNVNKISIRFHYSGQGWSAWTEK